MDFQPLIRALRARMKALWPEVAQIPDPRFAERLRWDQLPVPYGVVAMDTAGVGSWGAVNLGLEPVFELWYVSEDPDPDTPIDGKLLPLAIDLHFDRALYDGDDFAGQVVAVEEISWSSQLPANRRMAGTQGRRGGRVRVRCSLVLGPD